MQKKLVTSDEAMSAMPIAVDLDGSLSLADSLVEALITLALKQPLLVPAAFRAAAAGRPQLKAFLVAHNAYDGSHLPLREDLVTWLKSEHAKGRKLYLVTASPQSVAEEVARRLSIFEGAYGSTPHHNLKGEAKLGRIREICPEGFSYVGNDASDLTIWKHADTVLLAGSDTQVARIASNLGRPVEERFPDRKAGIRTWLKAMRIHQWAKNVLLFVPLFLAHKYSDFGAIVTLTQGFVYMGLVASATYILNDLSDLSADRQHKTKRRRPIASGAIPVQKAVVGGTAIGLAGLAGALTLRWEFALLLAIYVALTVSYSLRLKAIALLDVFILGLLFTLRILMGIVLIGSNPSAWLLTFSLFFFYSLSMAKRHVEIVRAAQRGHVGRIKGRGYEAGDAPLTLSLGVSASLASVTLLFLYVANDAFPRNVYASPEWLWGSTFLVFLWTTRIWLKSHRGKLDDDPVIFAIKDPPSWGLGAGVFVTFLLAVA